MPMENGRVRCPLGRSCGTASKTHRYGSAVLKEHTARARSNYGSVNSPFRDEYSQPRESAENSSDPYRFIETPKQFLGLEIEVYNDYEPEDGSVEVNRDSYAEDEFEWENQTMYASELAQEWLRGADEDQDMVCVFGDDGGWTGGGVTLDFIDRQRFINDPGRRIASNHVGVSQRFELKDGMLTATQSHHDNGGETYRFFPVNSEQRENIEEAVDSYYSPEF